MSVMNGYAKIASDWYAKRGTSVALASVYEDGIIVYLCITAATQALIEQGLGESVLGSARSFDGFCGVIILNDSADLRIIDFAMTGELTVLDNRDSDANTIEQFVGDRLSRQNER